MRLPFSAVVSKLFQGMLWRLKVFQRMFWMEFGEKVNGIGRRREVVRFDPTIFGLTSDDADRSTTKSHVTNQVS